MFDSIYHLALKLFWNRVLRGNAKILLYIRDVITDVNTSDPEYLVRVNT